MGDKDDVRVVTAGFGGWVGLLVLVMAGLSCHREKPMMRSLSAAETGVDFVNRLPERPGLGILSYIYYYNGAGVAVGDINNDGRPDLFFAANSRGQNRLYLNKGNFVFEDITVRAGVAGGADWCTGVTMADVNGDGLLDIYVCAVAHMQGFEGHNELYINNGNGTFTESAAAYGLDFSGFATQAVFFDYDHDGDLDCFILNQSQHPNQNITDTGKRRGFDVNSGERLYRNDAVGGGTVGGRLAGGRLVGGQRHFVDVSEAAGLYRSALCYGLGVAVGDLNNDGWEDIYVGMIFMRMISTISIMAMERLRKAGLIISGITAGIVWGMILPISTMTGSWISLRQICYRAMRRR